MPLPACGIAEEELLGNLLVGHPCPDFVVASKFGTDASGLCEEGNLPSCPLSQAGFGEEPKLLGVVPRFQSGQELGVVPKVTLPYPGFDAPADGVFQLNPGFGVPS